MTETTIFVGLDVHKKTIAVATVEGRASADVRFHGTIANTPEAIRSLLRKLGKGGQRLHLAYEAGPLGYNLYRLSTGLGHATWPAQLTVGRAGQQPAQSPRALSPLVPTTTARLGRPEPSPTQRCASAMPVVGAVRLVRGAPAAGTSASPHHPLQHNPHRARCTTTPHLPRLRALALLRRRPERAASHRHAGVRETLYGVIFVKGPAAAFPFLIPQFPCLTWKPVSSPRPTRSTAFARRSAQGWRVSATARPRP